MPSISLLKKWRFALLLLAPFAAVALLLVARSSDDRARASVVVPMGHDLLETDPTQTYQDLSLPPDFFGPGCEAFLGRVFLKGDPIPAFMGFGGLGPTDTIVERLADPGPAFPDTIPIEIVALSLVSASPITVTCPDGPQQWELRAQIFEGPNPPQILGQMTIRHEFPDGGTFDALLPVVPLLTFTRLDGPGHIGPFPLPGGPLNFQSTNVPWCHQANPLDFPPGHIVIERPPLTSDFFPGITCPEVGGQRIKEYFGEQALLAAHGVRPAEIPLVTPTPTPTGTPARPTDTPTPPPTDTPTREPTATPTSPPPDTATPTATATAAGEFHDDEVVGFLGWAAPNPHHVYALPLRRGEVHTRTLQVRVRNNTGHADSVRVALHIGDVVAGCGVETSEPQFDELGPNQTKIYSFRVSFRCEGSGVIQNAVTLAARVTHLGAPDSVPANNERATFMDVFIMAH